MKYAKFFLSRFGPKDFLIDHSSEEKKMVFKKFLKRFVYENTGATAVEYAVMIFLVIVVCLATVSLLGGVGR
jgi:Flp pilus assembly pilin Flp